MEGDGNGSPVQTASALYASAPDGQLVKVIEAGAPAPNGGTISDIGTPALGSDGSLIFGAEITLSGTASWRIFRASFNTRREVRIEQVIDDSATGEGYRPVLNMDPYVSAGSDGSFVFVGQEQRGGVALFRYAKGHIDCEIRVGDRTAEGQVVANLGFGSAQEADNGATVVQAYLARGPVGARRLSTRNAILLATPTASAKEIAVEGNLADHGGRYKEHFGLPAISVAGGKTLVAFTNQDAKGGALFVGQPGKLLRTIVTGSRTQRGPVTFLSDGRPSLGDDGAVAIKAATRKGSLIVLIRAGKPYVIAQEGDNLGTSHNLTELGDPAAELGGVLYAEGGDEQDRSRVYSFSATGSPTDASKTSHVLSSAIEVFPSSFAINRRGRFAFLASRVAGAETTVSHEDRKKTRDSETEIDQRN
jgi:hypothetical protein